MAPFIACLIDSVIQALRFVKNTLLISDDDLHKIGELRLMFAKLYYKYDRVWVHLQTNDAKEGKAQADFLC